MLRWEDSSRHSPCACHSATLWYGRRAAVHFLCCRPARKTRWQAVNGCRCEHSTCCRSPPPPPNSRRHLQPPPPPSSSPPQPQVPLLLPHHLQPPPHIAAATTIITTTTTSTTATTPSHHVQPPPRTAATTNSRRHLQPPSRTAAAAVALFACDWRSRPALCQTLTRQATRHPCRNFSPHAASMSTLHWSSCLRVGSCGQQRRAKERFEEMLCLQLSATETTMSSSSGC
jgi:hypothetical protein